MRSSVSYWELCALCFSSLGPCLSGEVARSMPSPILMLSWRHPTYPHVWSQFCNQWGPTCLGTGFWLFFLFPFKLCPNCLCYRWCSSVVWNVLLLSWGHGKQAVKLIILMLKARFKNHQWNTFQYNTFLFSRIICVPNLPEGYTPGKELPSHCFSARPREKQAVSRTSMLPTIILLSPKIPTQVSAEHLYFSFETICSSVFYVELGSV